MNATRLIQGQITEESVDLMRERIGFPNPTLRGGVINDRPWVTMLTADAIRHYAIGIGDGNPLYLNPDYAKASRWCASIAPPGIEMAMGWDRSATMDPLRAKATSKALRGVHLFHSGTETYYWNAVLEGATLYKSQWVQNVEVKTSSFAGKSAIVTNDFQYWNDQSIATTSGSNWFVHTERRQIEKSDEVKRKAQDAPAFYSDEQLAEIDAAYDAEFVRGGDTLYYEDVEIGQALPRMVKGPLTITDLFNLHIGAGWLTYGNPPFRLAYENRKMLRGFYSKNEYGAWDTLQRIHWDMAAAHEVGVLSTYDIGPVRQSMLNHYLTNFAGDDGWVHYVRCEFRNFNYMGDTTWLTGSITGKRIDPVLGPLLEVTVAGTNQRGKENIRGAGRILCASRSLGPVKLPPPPPLTPHRTG